MAIEVYCSRSEVLAIRCNPYKTQTPGKRQGEARMTDDQAPMTNCVTTLWPFFISYEYAASITLYTVRTL